MLCLSCSSVPAPALGQACAPLLPALVELEPPPPDPPHPPSARAAARAGMSSRRLGLPVMAGGTLCSRKSERAGRVIGYRAMAERAAIVTGASSGIGLALARMLGQEGYGLTVAARRPEKLEAAAEGLRGEGFEVEHVPANLTSEEAIQEVVNRHREK